MDLIEIVKNGLLQSQKLSLVLVVAEGCYERESVMAQSINEIILTNNLDVEFVILCFKEEELPWPTPKTQQLYYFAPGSTTPLISRHGKMAIDMVIEDVISSYEILSGRNKDEVLYKDHVSEVKQSAENFEKDKEYEYPSKFTMARNLAREFWISTKRLGEGLPVVTPTEVAFSRYEYCKVCPFFTDEERCERCGCVMSVKVNFASAECPEGKWSSYNN